MADIKAAHGWVMLPDFPTALSSIDLMQREGFPDSKIINSDHCGRTQTACILNYSLSNELTDARNK